jgi:2-polyprenyl-3-methyl-5-hydroxy-6-metoxy-1,4-benzoquinol methylase
MIHIHEHRYEYLEEVNYGIAHQFPPATAGGDQSVLDVGCGSGALAEAISRNGYRVCGIEVHPDSAQKAAGRIARAIQADLTDFNAVAAQLGQERFDHLIFSDVLEHLYDPFIILRQYLAFLKPGGRVFISVPNCVNWVTRLKFMFGSFRYADTGVMDRTHIRFFTFSTAKQLVRAAGCNLVKVDYTPFIVRAFLPLIKRLLFNSSASTDGTRRTLIDSPLFHFYKRFVYPFEYVLGYWCKPLFAFRIIIVGRKP